MDIDTTGYTNAAKLLLKEAASIDIIPPVDQKYSLTKKRYTLGNNDSVLLNELQYNLATVLALDPNILYWKAYIKAGYAYASYFNEGKNVKRIKAHLTGMTNQKVTPRLTAFINYIKYGAAEELRVDATWLLNEQVSLYQDCRRNKMYTQAVRLLNDISYHVDVDARVTNRIEVTDKLDYAALLSGAENRVKTLPASKDTEEVGGIPNLNSENIIDAEFNVVSPVETIEPELHQDTSPTPSR